MRVVTVLLVRLLKAADQFIFHDGKLTDVAGRGDYLADVALVVPDRCSGGEKTRTAIVLVDDRGLTFFAEYDAGNGGSKQSVLF